MIAVICLLRNQIKTCFHDLFYLGFLKQMDVGIFKKIKNKSKIIKYIHVHVCIPLLKLHRYISFLVIEILKIPVGMLSIVNM
jgi:hypothetical protein